MYLATVRKRALSVSPGSTTDKNSAPYIGLSPITNATDNLTVDITFKICLLGASSVGKTSLITQFLHGKFCSHHDHTIEETHDYRGRLSMIGKSNQITYQTEIVDTSGTYEELVISESSIQSCDGVLLVCSAQDITSIEALSTLYDHVLRVRGCSTVPALIVANKSETDQQEDHLVRQAAEKIGCKYMYASAKEGTNVALSFETLTRQIIHSMYIAPFLNGQVVQNAIHANIARKRRHSVSDKLQATVSKLFWKRKSIF
jgi:small GTP-binding protein